MVFVFNAYPFHPSGKASCIHFEMLVPLPVLKPAGHFERPRELRAGFYTCIRRRSFISLQSAAGRLKKSYRNRFRHKGEPSTGLRADHWCSCGSLCGVDCGLIVCTVLIVAQARRRQQSADRCADRWIDAAAQAILRQTKAGRGTLDCSHPPNEHPATLQPRTRLLSDLLITDICAKPARAR